MKTSPDDITVLLVGGGSIIASDTLAGVDKMIKPPFSSIANAVGAAMANGEPYSLPVLAYLLMYFGDEVAREVDTIEILAGRNLDEVVDSILFLEKNLFIYSLISRVL